MAAEEQSQFRLALDYYGTREIPVYAGLQILST